MRRDEIVHTNDLLDKEAVLHFFGGTRPINASTLYRGIKQGRYPSPIKIGPNSSRWIHSECEAARQAMIAARERREVLASTGLLPPEAA
jgi:predicted DNA-binding transcriptional regulator AlpA